MNDPVARFSAWLEEAKAHRDIREPTAMCLSTSTKDGVPSARMVLLKTADARGFSFFTNMESRKAEELRANPQAALCFYWAALGRQVRVEGRVETVNDGEADAYYRTRALISRVGAWASDQSRPLSSREVLMQRVEEVKQRFGLEGIAQDAQMDANIPRPPHWSGFRVVPERIEFWQEAPFRLHDRDCYEHHPDGGWKVEKLFP